MNGGAVLGKSDLNAPTSYLINEISSCSHGALSPC